MSRIHMHISAAIKLNKFQCHEEYTTYQVTYVHMTDETIQTLRNLAVWAKQRYYSHHTPNTVVPPATSEY